MQLSKPLRKRQVKISHNETESKIKPWMTVTLGVYYRREARAFLLSLHMGHCIVMGEALLVVVVPQEAPRIGTYSHFKMSCLTRPPSMPHMLKSHIKDAEAAVKAEGSCYMPLVMSQDSQKKRPCQRTNLHMVQR